MDPAKSVRSPRYSRAVERASRVPRTRRYRSMSAVSRADALLGAARPRRVRGVCSGGWWGREVALRVAAVGDESSPSPTAKRHFGAAATERALRGSGRAGEADQKRSFVDTEKRGLRFRRSPAFRLMGRSTLAPSLGASYLMLCALSPSGRCVNFGSGTGAAQGPSSRYRLGSERPVEPPGIARRTSRHSTARRAYWQAAEWFSTLRAISTDWWCGSGTSRTPSTVGSWVPMRSTTALTRERFERGLGQWTWSRSSQSGQRRTMMPRFARYSRYGRLSPEARPRTV